MFWIWMNAIQEIAFQFKCLRKILVFKRFQKRVWHLIMTTQI